MEKIKILIINSVLPFPTTTGGDQAVINIINGLQYKCEVHFLFQLQAGADLNMAKKNWSKVTLHSFTKTRTIPFYLSRMAIHYAHRFQQNNKKYDYLINPSLYYVNDFITFIRHTIDLIKPDIVQTEFYPNLELVYALPNSIKKVFVQHEIHYTINEQRRNNDSKWGSMQSLSLNKLKAEEITAMNQYDAVFTLTQADCDKLQADGVQTKIYASPVGIESPQKRNPCSFQNHLIFVGAGTHSPNIEGIMWFLDNVWDSITEKHPQIKLNVVGKWNKIQIRQLQKYKNVTFKGFVKSLKDEYNGAIAIIPIIRGSGLRMKIIDAVNYGSPFISTTIGAFGMKFSDGKDCYIADRPTEFASKLLDMINNERTRNIFYTNSATTINKYYSVRNLVERRYNLYQSLLIEM